MVNPVFPCGRVQRRQFLADCGWGFTGLALSAMLQRDGTAAERPEDTELVRCRQFLSEHVRPVRFCAMSPTGLSSQPAPR